MLIIKKQLIFIFERLYSLCLAQCLRVVVAPCLFRVVFKGHLYYNSCQIYPRDRVNIPEYFSGLKG